MRATLLAALVVGVLGLTGCQAPAQAGPRQARGWIISVQVRSIVETESITLRADDGRELVFRVDRAVAFTPGHLREHMTLGAPVLVYYEQGPDGLRAVRIDDA